MTDQGLTTDHWALSTDIRVAWGDMDAFGHVNNTVYLRWFETARIEWLALVEFPEGPSRGPMLKTVGAVYDAQVKYPDTVTVSVRAEKPGRTSVKLVYRVVLHSTKRVVATGESVVVLVENGAATPLPDDLRGRLGRTAPA
jgi:acyl-CoA thioester hydrolase